MLHAFIAGSCSEIAPNLVTNDMLARIMDTSDAWIRERTGVFLSGIEYRLLGSAATRFQRLEFRKETQREYTSRSLTQEIMVEGLKITQTAVFQDLRERYIYNLKEKVLDPLLENENFRRAIKEFNEEGFKTYDKKIREDVSYLITNLGKKYRYSEQGAKEVCIYVIDNDLAKKFATS